MKVLINTPNLELPGGVANYYNTIRQKFSVDVDYFTVGAAKVGESKVAFLRRFFYDFWHFYQVLRKGRYDIVHLNPSLVPLSIIRDGIFHIIAKMRGSRTVVFVRGWDVKCELQIERWFMPLFRYAYFSADAFIVLADEFKQYLQRVGYKGPVFLETTVVDDSVFEACDDIDTERSLENGVGNILFLSRIEKDKGVYVAIDAFRIVREKYPDICISIAGTGDEIVRVKQYVEDNHVDGVAFLGFVQGEAKRDAWCATDIYLFPTRYAEGMPNAVLEAMSYGVPVVTRPVGGVRDFFENGKMGFITESNDAHDFSLLLLKLIGDSELRAEIGAYNQGYAKQRFSATKVVGRLQDIYRQVSENA